MQGSQGIRDRSQTGVSKQRLDQYNNEEHSNTLEKGDTRRSQAYMPKQRLNLYLGLYIPDITHTNQIKSKYFFKNLWLGSSPSLSLPRYGCKVEGVTSQQTDS